VYLQGPLICSKVTGDSSTAMSACFVTLLLIVSELEVDCLDTVELEFVLASLEEFWAETVELLGDPFGKR